MCLRLAKLVIATTAAAMLTGCGRGAAEESPRAGAGPMTGSADAMSSMGSHFAAAHDAKAEAAFLFPSGDDRGWTAVNGNPSHMMSPPIPFEGLSTEMRRQLIRQLTLTAEVSRKYPTVRDAEAAGYRRAGPFVAGLGVHYLGKGRTTGLGPITDDEILHPLGLVFDGLVPDAPISGLMYSAPPGATEPEGFAGPNDHWHVHLGACVVADPQGSTDVMGANDSISADDCKTRGGQYLPGGERWLHVWTVPAYTNPLGVFAHRNPAITCPDGTYYTDRRDLRNWCAHR